MPPASVAEAELDRRAEHAVRPLAADLAPADLHAVRHRRADGRQRHQIADRHVEGAAPRSGAAARRRRRRRRSWMWSASGWGRSASTFGDDDAVDRLADPLDVVDREAEVVHQRRRARRRRRRRARARAARSRSTLHQNCSRKRMSLVNISRRSSTPWRASGQAVDAEAEREAAPLLGVEPAVAQHVGVDHAAAAELEPRAVGALDVVLGRRLGEREVRRPQPRRGTRGPK